MTQRVLPVFVASVAVLLLLCAPAWGAWIIEQEESSPEQGEQVRKTMIFGKDVLRMDVPQAHTTVIMDFGKDRMLLLDHAQKLYTEVRISEMSQQAKEMLPQTSPTATVAAQKTPQFETISGFACQKIIVTHRGQPAGEIWVTPEIKSDNIASVYQKFFEMIGMGDPSQSGSIALIGGLKAALTTGFPILIDMTLPDGGKIRVRTLSAVEKDLDAGAFTAPPGYTRMMLPGPSELPVQSPPQPKAP